jgi:hypothetical protein
MTYGVLTNFLRVIGIILFVCACVCIVGFQIISKRVKLPDILKRI